MATESSSGVANYGPLLNGAIWALTGVSTLFLCLRIFAKVSRRMSLWWDDHFLIVSWVCLVVSAALLTKGVTYGIGLHYDDMLLENVPKVSAFSYAAGFTTILGTCWSKTSFGITLLRISNGWVKWFVWFLIVSVNLVLTASAVLLWAQCWPVKKLFSDIEDGTCLPKQTVEDYQTFCSAYSGAMDIVLALLPWKIVWKAAIFRKEKIGILICMSMGVFSGIMSFLKIISLGDISDIRSTSTDLKIFGIAELATTIIAVSIPILRAFIRRRATTAAQSEFVEMSRLHSVGSSLRHDRKDEFSATREIRLTLREESNGRSHVRARSVTRDEHWHEHWHA